MDGTTFLIIRRILRVTLGSRIVSLGLALVCILGESTSARMSTGQQVHIARQSAPSVFQSDVGELRPLEVSFDPKTRNVTIRLAVQDPTGYFIPNLRRNNFAVYENGQLQKNASVDVEHALVSLTVLLEAGGRYQELSGILNTEIPAVGGKLRDVLLPGDKVAVFAYADGVNTLASIDDPPERLNTIFTRFRIAGFSEANLYDALITVMDRTRSMAHRRALLLISTGLDSFSHATFDDVIATAGRSDTPVYCIGLAGLVQRTIPGAGPLARIDWSRANIQLKTLARVTDGRAYLRETDLHVPAIYDDFMEHLRVRYAITYTAASDAPSGSSRTVRVALVDPRTGGPLRISDSAGRVIVARVSGEASYTR